MPRSHTSVHKDPTHHIGSCDAACRAGLKPHYHRDIMGTSERMNYGGIHATVWTSPPRTSPRYAAGVRRKKLNAALARRAKLVRSGRAPRSKKGRFVRRKK